MLNIVYVAEWIDIRVKRADAVLSETKEKLEEFKVVNTGTVYSGFCVGLH